MYDDVKLSVDAQRAIQKAQGVAQASVVNAFKGTDFMDFFIGLTMAKKGDKAPVNNMLAKFEREMAASNAISKAFRKNTRMAEFPAAPKEMRKAALDVGSLTDFSQVTGGQSLGYVSLDVQMARGTVRPGSFTMYNALNKTAAYQIVDFWPYASETGGLPPGSSFASYGSVSSGAVTPNAGKYDLKYITLKLALDPRAITMALAAQNSFVDVSEQETTNAALSVLSSVNWACYWGDPTKYANQPAGIASQILTKNTFNFQDFYTAYATAEGWTPEQTLFNMMYEVSAKITSWNQFGKITHAFMSPTTSASLQSLVTTQINNILNDLTAFQAQRRPIIVNGDLQGMYTRFGPIQFPVDLFIDARDIPLAGQPAEDATTQATSTSPAPPVSATATADTSATVGFATAYVASSAAYKYYVVSCDDNMIESTGVWASASGATVGQAYAIDITPPADASASYFRIFRSGLGYTGTDPAKVRFIGDVAADGHNAVQFVDDNTHIPGSQTIFMVDLDDEDQALDYRYLLPLTRLELFSMSMYMPWLVAAIGSPRLKVPKFHGIIENYVPTDPRWDPLKSNA